MARHTCILVWVIWSFVTSGWSWDVLTNIGSRRAQKKPYIFKNEYVYGDCKSPRSTKKLYHHVTKTWADVQKAAIIREMLAYVKSLPRCVILRASSYEHDTYRVTRYNMEICVVRLSFCYWRKRNNYYFYEWYIPEDIMGGLGWDVYFYGPGKDDWTSAE